MLVFPTMKVFDVPLDIRYALEVILLGIDRRESVDKSLFFFFFG